MIDKMIPN
jgi:hypothetical protein